MSQLELSQGNGTAAEVDKYAYGFAPKLLLNDQLNQQLSRTAANNPFSNN